MLMIALGAKVLQLSRAEGSAATGYRTAEAKPLKGHFALLLAPCGHQTRHVFNHEQRYAHNYGQLLQQWWLRAAELLRAESHSNYA